MAPQSTTPGIILEDSSTASSALLDELKSHLPFSLPVLRRIQFANNFPGGSTPSTHVLHATYNTNNTPGYDGQERHFAAAYLDLSRHPETQCWLYCTLEDYHVDPGAPITNPLPPPSEEAIIRCDALIRAILRRIKEISLSPEQGLAEPVFEEAEDGGAGKREIKLWGGGQYTVLIGSLHEAVRQRILGWGVRMGKTRNVGREVEWEFCGKWLFDTSSWADDDDDGVVGSEFDFDRARKEDIELVRSRTKIDRKERTLLMLPSTIIRGDDGKPMAWAFMALDGTLMSLHVEEPHRGKGLAKAIARKLMRDRLKHYGDDGWGAADVFVSNIQSQGVCKSLGGKMWWTLSWAILDLSTLQY